VPVSVPAVSENRRVPEVCLLNIPHPFRGDVESLETSVGPSASDSWTRELIPLLEHPPEFYVVTMAVLSILGTMIGVGHLFVGLLRNIRNFRDGD
jgi:hypothetical protein